MYAVIETGGKQYRVQEGDEIIVEKLAAEVGEKVSFDKVLVMGEGADLQIGTPYVDALVYGQVEENGKGDKVIIYKYKAKKDYRKKQGHRQPFTKVLITGIGEDKPAPVKVEEAPASEADQEAAPAEESGVSMAFVLGSQEGLAEKISNADSEDVIVTIPKIDLETDFSNKEFVDFLEGSGVSLAFDETRADFSAMLDYPVFVSNIIQKTRIKLDEEGVEAAAVTAILMDKSASVEPKEPKEFIANEPFSFYIYTTCNDTTAVLFAGEIVE